jgi:HAD superfamily hydrolase (TIGR01484 family)
VRYIALAVDFGGTLAKNGKVTKKTVAALEKVLDSGRRLILVTGRELPVLQQQFDRLDLFDYVVAENGGLLYHPKTKAETILGEAPPEELIDLLRERGVKKLTVGNSIVATVRPHETVALDAIRELGLEWQVIFNKESVMLLPASVNKESGLRAALDALHLSPHNVAGIGEAENDHAFLSLCEGSAAVANALPAVQERADVVMQGEYGAGVVEFIEMLIDDDLASIAPKRTRHDILLGTRADESNGKKTEVMLKPYGTSILVAGPSGSGKSTATTGIMERLAEQGYQFCLIDPEGDYESFAGAITFGNQDLAPNVDEALQLLAHPNENVVINLLGVRLEDRPGFFASLLPRLQELRVKTGRPHWIIIDEVHHLLPRNWKPSDTALPRQFGEMLMITVHPDWVAPGVLSEVNAVIAVGGEVEATYGGFAKALRTSAPKIADAELEPGQVMLWRRGSRTKPVKVDVTPAKAERRRHQRKYAAGELIYEEHFVFRGPHETLNLRAQNLIVFLQMAEGIDDETWTWHLERGDYTNWFRHVIKDDDLAEAGEKIAKRKNLSPAKSRELIRDEVEKRYTLPANWSPS